MSNAGGFGWLKGNNHSKEGEWMLEPMLHPCETKTPCGLQNGSLRHEQSIHSPSFWSGVSLQPAKAASIAHWLRWTSHHDDDNVDPFIWLQLWVITSNMLSLTIGMNLYPIIP